MALDMTASPESADIATADIATADIDVIVLDWLTANLGTVLDIRREGRWRAAWYAHVAAKDGVLSLYIRGARDGRWPPQPLSYEAEVQHYLGEQGLKVPKIYGFIPSVPAMVMECVPGRANLATADDEASRHAIVEQLVDQMRLMHRADPSGVVAAGAPNPADPAALALNSYREVEQIYLDGDKMPSPDIEFVRRWLDRNVPPCVNGPSVIAMDAGQFVFEGAELTSLIDFEFVSVGDYHTDFAALRTRTKIEPLGDLPTLMRLYEDRGGKPIDIARVRYHSVAFSLFTPLEIAHDLARPQSTLDFHEYTIWHTASIKDALEGIAEIEGYALDIYEPPAKAPSRAASTMESMDLVLSQLPAPDDYAAFRRDSVLMALRFLHKREAWRDAFEREYCDDVEMLTGARPASEWEADVQLEAYVRAASSGLDEPIVRLLHRRVQRTALLLAEEGTHLFHSLRTPLEPLRPWR